MPNNNGPSGPYTKSPPPPPPPPPAPVALYVPDTVKQLANDEQLTQIAVIELAFAQRVSLELAEAYTDILTVLRGDIDDEEETETEAE